MLLTEVGEVRVESIHGVPHYDYILAIGNYAMEERGNGTQVFGLSCVPDGGLAGVDC